MLEEEDRFGISNELIRQELEVHRGLIRIGCYIPTRQEVATADPAWLKSVLNDCWWESPTSLMPTYGQVREVVAILKARPDADREEIQCIITQAPTDEDFL